MSEVDKGRILVVDDNEYNRDMLSRWVKRQGYSFALAENGLEALAVLDQEPVDLMLLDIMMPEMNGFQVLDILRKKKDVLTVPVIVISAADDQENIVKCIELGAEDFLFKPFNRVLLKARIESSMEKKRWHDKEEMYRKQIEVYNQELEKRVREQVKEIAAAQLATITALAKLSESRDTDTGKHIERVSEYCKVLLVQLNHLPKYDELIDDLYIENVYAASALHDVGKVGIPDQILLKPGKLTTEEFEIMKTHTTIGAETLRNVNTRYPGNEFVQTGIEIAISHHEKWDGSGYPQKLSEEDIPLSGRVLALADVYDALTSKRCYKEALSHEESVEIIVGGQGQHFDPDLVNSFLDIRDEFKEIRVRLQDKNNGFVGKNSD